MRGCLPRALSRSRKFCSALRAHDGQVQGLPGPGIYSCTPGTGRWFRPRVCTRSGWRPGGLRSTAASGRRCGLIRSSVSRSKTEKSTAPCWKSGRRRWPGQVGPVADVFHADPLIPPLEHQLDELRPRSPPWSGPRAAARASLAVTVGIDAPCVGTLRGRYGLRESSKSPVATVAGTAAARVRPVCAQTDWPVLDILYGSLQACERGAGGNRRGCNARGRSNAQNTT